MTCDQMLDFLAFAVLKKVVAKTLPFADAVQQSEACEQGGWDAGALFSRIFFTIYLPPNLERTTLTVGPAPFQAQ